MIEHEDELKRRVELSPLCAHSQPLCTRSGVCSTSVSMFVGNTEALQIAQAVLEENGFSITSGNWIHVEHQDYERFLEVLEAADVAYWIAFQ